MAKYAHNKNVHPHYFPGNILIIVGFEDKKHKKVTKKC